MKNKIYLRNYDQIDGSTVFFNSPPKIRKFDTIGFEILVEMREIN
jgi:hypothetical protein